MKKQDLNSSIVEVEEFYNSMFYGNPEIKPMFWFWRGSQQFMLICSFSTEVEKKAVALMGAYIAQKLKADRMVFAYEGWVVSVDENDQSEEAQQLMSGAIKARHARNKQEGVILIAHDNKGVNINKVYHVATDSQGNRLNLKRTNLAEDFSMVGGLFSHPFTNMHLSKVHPLVIQQWDEMINQLNFVNRVLAVDMVDIETRLMANPGGKR